MKKPIALDTGASSGKKVVRESARPIDKPKALACCCAALCALTVGTVVWAGVNTAGTSGEIARLKADARPAVVAAAAISSGDLSDGVVADLEAVVGKTATANIPANAQVTQSNLAGEGNTTALAEALEPGFVAVSVAVNSETGVAGLVRQGDRVDVLAEGSTIIEDARILALDAQLSGEITQYSTVTLEVTEGQAGDIQAAQMDGAVRLALNPHVSEGA